MVSKELQQLKQTDLSVVTPANLPQVNKSLKQISGNNLSTITTDFPNKRTNQQVSPFSDYNDPTQINSFADIIWNTLSKNDKLKTRDYGLLSDIGNWDIPFLTPIVGVFIIKKYKKEEFYIKDMIASYLLLILIQI